jgi:hypothetical protein
MQWNESFATGPDRVTPVADDCRMPLRFPAGRWFGYTQRGGRADCNAGGEHE